MIDIYILERFLCDIITDKSKVTSFNPNISMLYELVGIARVPMVNHHQEAASMAKSIGKMILGNRGVIRDLDNWGIRYLPGIWNKNRESHILGAHFYMKFDCSPAVQREIQRSLLTDPRMLRSTIVKLGGENLSSLID